MPDVADANVIEVFLSRTTCESLVHKLGRKGPRTTKEHLNIVTSHALGEEVVEAIFDRAKGKAKRDKDDSGGRTSSDTRARSWPLSS